MSVEDTLYTTLSGNAGIAALVSTRIFPDAIPEDKALPAVVYSRTGTDPYPSLSGADFGADITLNIQSWAKTRTQADQIGGAIEAALLGTDFYKVARDVGMDPETGLFATILSYEIFD